MKKMTEIFPTQPYSTLPPLDPKVGTLLLNYKPSSTPSVYLKHLNQDQLGLHIINGKINSAATHLMFKDTLLRDRETKETRKRPPGGMKTYHLLIKRWELLKLCYNICQ